MEKITINGVEFNDFGTNNYSEGMRLITVYPMPENIVEDVLNGKYHNVYLNPSAPCENEFFGVYGTPEQYEKFYSRQCKACKAEMVLEEIDWDFNNPKYYEIKDKVEREYKDWWL